MYSLIYNLNSLDKSETKMCTKMNRFFKLNFVLFTMIMVGCGSQAMVDSGEPVEISGVVTLDGKPLSEAEVIFISADGDSLVAPGMAMTDNKGKYTITVDAPREYKVTVDRMMNGGPHPGLKNYQGDGTSLKASVSKEKKTFDFKLEKSK